MVFSSMIFLCVFMPAVFLLHTFIHNIHIKNFILLIASILFYAYGEPVYVLLLIGSALINYLFGLLIEKYEKKALIVLAVLTDLSILGTFKYAGFLAEMLNRIPYVEIPVPHIRLPIGISFFIFQAMSYIIDVWRKKVKAQHSFPKLLLYISLFPQLIAGPIVRYSDIEDELTERKASVDDISDGMNRFIFGLGKKVLLANTMGAVADAVFNSINTGAVNISLAWIGALSYLFQIYFDFSGYSDMAIGLGRMFGFHFLENFNYPYCAKSIQEFWRRWHMSLTSWFREYLYIPLGGNRKGTVRTILNRITVFLCTGIWHGANLTFIFWGLYHGFFLMLETLVSKLKPYNTAENNGNRNKVLLMFRSCLQHIYTIIVVTVGFVFFRAETIRDGFYMVKEMFSGFQFGSASISLTMQQLTPLYLFTLAACILFSVKFRIKKTGSVYTALSYAGHFCILAVCLLRLSGSSYNPFIYFQF